MSAVSIPSIPSVSQEAALHIKTLLKHTHKSRLEMGRILSELSFHSGDVSFQRDNTQRDSLPQPDRLPDHKRHQMFPTQRYLGIHKTRPFFPRHSVRHRL